MVLLLALAFAADLPNPRPEDTWDLSQVYPSVAAWETALSGVETDLAQLEACKGQLATRLGPCLATRFELQKRAYRVYTYASNASNVDTRDDAWLGRSQRAEQLLARFGEAESFLAPELLGVGAPAVEAALARDPTLAPYDAWLRSTLKHAPHTLDADGEQLLASTAGVLAAPDRMRTVLVNGELPWPTVTLSDGTSARLDPSAYVMTRSSPVRADRELVFTSFFGALAGFQGVLGAMLDTAVQGHWFTARARGYPTSVAAALSKDHVPAAVYDTLVQRTNANLPTLHRYLRLRARMLGLTDLGYPDLYPALVDLDRSWTVDQAKALTLEACRPLGPAYGAALKEGLAARWMDVYPAPGKVGGAYMDGAAVEVHPYLLLNYTGDYESLTTFAHEWGHAMHSVLSARAQPYPKADYSSFTAEVASTLNEALLLELMLKGARTDDERLYYLGQALEGLRGTYFRQAQLAEFELAMHTRVEKGEPLTGDALSAMYLEVLKRYYGADAGVTRIDPAYGVEWAYIPHFYYDFYVYQYATSIAASSLLAEDVLAKKPGALDRTLALFQAGGSDEPYLLLQRAGVDLATPAPYDAVARRMNRIMDEMEAILTKREPGPRRR